MVCAKLTKELHNINIYGDEVMQMTAKTFAVSVIELGKMVSDTDGNEHKVLLHPSFNVVYWWLEVLAGRHSSEN